MPRIPIDATNTPSQNANDDYTISAPGSYYLTGNITISKFKGIHVTSSNVSINLNGFTVSGAPANNGFTVSSGPGCSIINGRLGGLNSAIVGLSGLTIRDVECDHCTNGIFASANAVLDCVTDTNNGSGINAGNGCKVAGCVASGNGRNGMGSGIVAGIRATVDNCNTVGNSVNGIFAGGDSSILNNHSSQNGGGTPGAGIVTTSGTGSRIEGNSVRDNAGVGINASSLDTIIHNTSGNKTTNYSPVSGPNFGPIQGVSIATSPFANF